MKIIYSIQTQSTISDIGIIQDCKFDLAYGSDENDFSLTVPLKNHVLTEDAQYIIYAIEEEDGTEVGTEYGGYVDSIKVDTKKKEVTYLGRTWHGILNSCVIHPDEQGKPMTVSGDAHDIMSDILNDPSNSVPPIISISSAVSEIAIGKYTFERYDFAYDGFRKMVEDSGGKLKIVFDTSTQKAVVSAKWATSFDQAEQDFNSTQVTLKASSEDNAVTHLICTGSDDDGFFYDIHLFTDKNGGVRPYKTSAGDPIEDSDYILDESQRYVTPDYTDIYEAGKVTVVKNYKLATEQPADWDSVFMTYYVFDAETGKYNLVKYEEEDVYTLLTSQPSSWSVRYMEYYTSDHKNVQGVESTTYREVEKKPEDWDENYRNYYERHHDGTQYVYTNISAVTSYIYKEQTQEPSDWDEHYSSYYQKKVKKTTKTDNKKKTKKDKAEGDGYETVKAVNNSAPEWKKNKYYTRFSESNPPKWKDFDAVYSALINTSPPTWQADTYYSKSSQPIVPEFKTKTYYEQVYDHYKKMVDKGLDVLKKYSQYRDTIELNLDLYGEFDIGDIVSATEQITGIDVRQPIVKKIVSISRKGKTISYKIGQNKTIVQ